MPPHPPRIQRLDRLHRLLMPDEPRGRQNLSSMFLNPLIEFTG